MYFIINCLFWGEVWVTIHSMNPIRKQEIDDMKESSEEILWVWAGFHYRKERTVDIFHREIWCELLAVDTTSAIDKLLNNIQIIQLQMILIY